MGFLQVLRFPPQGKFDRMGRDKINVWCLFRVDQAMIVVLKQGPCTIIKQVKIKDLQQ